MYLLSYITTQQVTYLNKNQSQLLSYTRSCFWYKLLLKNANVASINISMAELQPFQSYEPHLFPRLERVGNWIAEHLSILPSESELCLTEHRGAAAMLDSHLDDEPQLPLADAGWNERGEFERR